MCVDSIVFSSKKNLDCVGRSQVRTNAIFTYFFFVFKKTAAQFCCDYADSRCLAKSSFVIIPTSEGIPYQLPSGRCVIIPTNAGMKMNPLDGEDRPSTDKPWRISVSYTHL